MKEGEHVEQKQLFRWTRLHEDRLPELKLLFAVPNGGQRHLFVAKKLQAEGVKPGVLDVWFPVPRAGFHGLVIEMKAPGKLKETSDAQKWWLARLTEQGYCAVVHDTWQAAWNTLVRYLGRPDLAQLVVGGVA